jgi:hypothetical protein
MQPEWPAVLRKGSGVGSPGPLFGWPGWEHPKKRKSNSLITLDLEFFSAGRGGAGGVGGHFTGRSVFFVATMAEEEMKSGYLRKQGSLIKNWKRRLFELDYKEAVLRYKDERGRVKGEIRLNGSWVQHVDRAITRYLVCCLDLLPRFLTDLMNSQFRPLFRARSRG